MSSQSFKHMMDSFSTTTAALAPDGDRRSMLRIEIPFPALVRGVDVHHQAFEEQTVLDNLSANRLSLRLGRCVDLGATLFIVLRLGVQPDAPAPRVALRGIIQRMEPHSDATCTLAIVFSHYRFLYASAE